MNDARRWHGMAKMTLNGRTILVVAGGQGEGLETLDSVEILDPSACLDFRFIFKTYYSRNLFDKYISVEL